MARNSNLAKQIISMLKCLCESVYSFSSYKFLSVGGGRCFGYRTSKAPPMRLCLYTQKRSCPSEPGRRNGSLRAEQGRKVAPYYFAETCHLAAAPLGALEPGFVVCSAPQYDEGTRKCAGRATVIQPTPPYFKTWLQMAARNVFGIDCASLVREK